MAGLTEIGNMVGKTEAASFGGGYAEARKLGGDNEARNRGGNDEARNIGGRAKDMMCQSEDSCATYKVTGTTLGVDVFEDVTLTPSRVDARLYQPSVLKYLHKAFLNMKGAIMPQEKYRFMRDVSRLVLVSMLSVSLPIQSALAGLVETDRVAILAQSAEDRGRIIAFLDREEVTAQLQQHGVTATEAKARVKALTDDEVRTVLGKMDQLPAGGDVLGVLLTVFIVLLITDILGFTKVFPFTKPVKR
ncbi:MAG: PA2779 family protein [Burkholderiales bacterium]